MPHKNSGQRKHMLLMLLFCLIPILLIIGMRFFNIGGSTLLRFSPFIFPILCMVIHLFMMKGMMGHDEGGCHGNKDENQKDL